MESKRRHSCVGRSVAMQNRPYCPQTNVLDNTSSAYPVSSPEICNLWGGWNGESGIIITSDASELQLDDASFRLPSVEASISVTLDPALSITISCEISMLESVFSSNEVCLDTVVKHIFFCLNFWVETSFRFVLGCEDIPIFQQYTFYF